MTSSFLDRDKLFYRKSQLTVSTGPIIGGFVAARTTWRWMFWATSIFQAAMMFASYFSFHESYGTLILRRRAERLRQQLEMDDTTRQVNELMAIGLLRLFSYEL